MNTFIRLKYPIVLVLAGIVCIIMGARNLNTSNADPIDLNDPSVNWNDLKAGDHVEMDVDFLMDYFVTVTENDKETIRVYAMPQLDDSGEYFAMTNFIGIDVNSSSEFSKYDALVDESLDWWTSDDIELNTTPIHINGKVAKMDKDKIEFFEEYLDEIDADSDVVDNSMYEYYIVPLGTEKSNSFTVIIGSVVLLAGVAWGGLVVAKGRR